MYGYSCGSQVVRQPASAVPPGSHKVGPLENMKNQENAKTENAEFIEPSGAKGRPQGNPTEPRVGSPREAQRHLREPSRGALDGPRAAQGPPGGSGWTQGHLTESPGEPKGSPGATKKVLKDSKSTPE